MDASRDAPPKVMALVSRDESRVVSEGVHILIIEIRIKINKFKKLPPKMPTGAISALSLLRLFTHQQDARNKQPWTRFMIAT